MKTLVKLSAFFCMVCLVITCTKDPSYIPIKDETFLNILIEKGTDRNGDGHISASEAEAIKSPDIYGNTIEDMQGLEAFINLDTLICGWNRLSALDVSNLPNLVFLDCSGNDISSLDISANRKLDILDCSFNEITSLDVSRICFRGFSPTVINI